MASLASGYFSSSYSRGPSRSCAEMHRVDVTPEQKRLASIARMNAQRFLNAGGFTYIEPS
tara:strand:- start:788 stop:967 length:180 start_codon:yes stop_codon:yes gene_type:complete